MKKYLLFSALSIAGAASLLLADTQIRDNAQGYQIGILPIDKVGFHGALPTVQRSGSAQTLITDSSGGTPSTTLPASVNTQALTDSTGGTPSTTLAAISDTATKNAVSSLNAQLAAQRTLNTHLINDISSLTVLVNELQAALAQKGLIKGGP